MEFSFHIYYEQGTSGENIGRLLDHVLPPGKASEGECGGLQDVVLC